MRAWQFDIATSGSLVMSQHLRPVVEAGELLIKIRAAGIIPTERGWYPTTHIKDGSARFLAVPSHEFSGVIEDVGPSVSGWRKGEAVVGMNDWFKEGALADFCVAGPESIVRKPDALTFVDAATVPISALTAWQGLLERAKLQKGQTVLIHGAAGAVGLYAVQLALNAGAHVIATASGEHVELLTKLGCREVIDYKAVDFRETVGPVDVVFDTVGGETLAHSWQVLQEGGKLVTIASDAESSKDQRVKDAFLLVEANATQLETIMQMIADHRLQTFVKEIVLFDQAKHVFEANATINRNVGKVVVEL